MGQDYTARKTAKKQRKRDARNAEMPGRGGKKRKQRGKDGLDVVGEDEGLLAPADVKRRRKKGNNVSLRISRWACGGWQCACPVILTCARCATRSFGRTAAAEHGIAC
jgi:hypothetical protein